MRRPGIPSKRSDKTDFIFGTNESEPKANFVYHVIQPGDTLLKISHRYNGISIEELKSMNDISNPRSLKPGMKLKVPVKG